MGGGGKHADAFGHGGDDDFVKALVGVAVGIVGVASETYYGVVAVVVAGGGVEGERPVVGVNEDFVAFFVLSIGYSYGVDGHCATVKANVLIPGEGDDVAVAVALKDGIGLGDVEAGDVHVVAAIAELDFKVHVSFVAIAPGVAVVGLELDAIGEDDFSVILAGLVVLVVDEFGGIVAEFLYLVVVVPYGADGVGVVGAVLQGEHLAAAFFYAVCELDVVGQVVDAHVNAVADDADSGVVHFVVEYGLAGLDGDGAVLEGAFHPCIELGAAYEVVEEHGAVLAEGHLDGAALLYFVDHFFLLVVIEELAGAVEFFNDGVLGCGGDDAVGVDGFAVGTLRLGEGEGGYSKGSEEE